MIPIDLSGKTALVTGGGQGLGAAICKQLSTAGANVVANYFNDCEGINQKRAVRTVEKLNGRAIAIEADVRNAEQVRRMIKQTIEHFGGLDIVVNNAGIIRDRTLKNMSCEEWNTVIDTNLNGVFNVLKESAEKIAEGGRIINIASISAEVGFFGQTNYAASKAGVIAITKVLSKELAKRKITVNAVAPGVVHTEMAETIPEEVREKMLTLIPMGRFGKPEEIANVIVFLCSDLSSYISGQTIHINGGWIG